MGLGDRDFVIASVIVLAFIALVLAMTGAWLSALGMVGILGTVVYARLVRPSPPRR